MIQFWSFILKRNSEKKNKKLQGERPKYCEGPAEKSEACNTDPCEMQWSEWSPCNVNCGMGSRTRITKCAEVANGPVKPCKELGLTEQAFEHIQECNTWNLETCPR